MADPLPPNVDAWLKAIAPPPEPRGIRNHECSRCGRMVNRLRPHACKLPELQPLPDPPRDLECSCGMFVTVIDGQKYLQPSGARHRDHPAVPEFIDEELELRIHRWYETEEGRAGARALERPAMATYQRPKRLEVNPEPQAPVGPEAAAPAKPATRRRGRTL